MEFKILREKDREIEVSVIGADDTLMYPLLTELLNEDKVVEARYFKGHPDLDVPSILLKVSSGDPKDYLIEAARNVSKQFSELRTKLQKLIG